MKKIKYLIFIIFIFCISILKVNAFSITGQSSTTVGSSIAVKVEASGLVGRFDVSSSDGSVLSGGKSIWLENNTTTLYFTAQKAGTASITVNATDVADEAGNTFTGKRILYVTVKEKSSSTGSSSNNNGNNKKPSVDVNKKYSSNNYLSSLSIDGYTLDPVFNKDTLEYSVSLKVDTTKINVSATTEDNKASVKGIGEVAVNDGPNTIIVVVTAENGNEKQYKINATVLEPEPIEIKLGNKKYTVVRKESIENIPSGFVETKISLENQDILAYKSDTAKLTLVALKDETGKISLFIYDTVNKSFKEFKEVKSNLMNLVIIDNKTEEIPYDFEKTEFDYNGVKINGYKLKNVQDSNYYVVYAKNLENGNEDFYLYDKKESTFQRYYADLVDTKNKQIKEVLYVAAGSLGLLVLIIFIKLLSKIFTSKKRKIRKYEKKLSKLKGNISFEEEQDDFYDLDKLDDKPIIKKVEEDEYLVPRKSRKEKLREIREAKERLERTKSIKRISLDDDEE